MIPTNGRIVLYHAIWSEESFDHPAIVTNVSRFGEILVCNLTVFTPNGGTYGVIGIEEGAGQNQWSWPPRV